MCIRDRVCGVCVSRFRPCTRAEARQLLKSKRFVRPCAKLSLVSLSLSRSQTLPSLSLLSVLHSVSGVVWRTGEFTPLLLLLLLFPSSRRGAATSPNMFLLFFLRFSHVRTRGMRLIRLTVVALQRYERLCSFGPRDSDCVNATSCVVNETQPS